MHKSNGMADLDPDGYDPFEAFQKKTKIIEKMKQKLKAKLAGLPLYQVPQDSIQLSEHY